MCNTINLYWQTEHTLVLVPINVRITQAFDVDFSHDLLCFSLTAGGVPYCESPELSEKLKIGIKILERQAIRELLIKTILCTFRSITQELLDLLNEILMPILSFSHNLLQDVRARVFQWNSAGLRCARPWVRAPLVPTYCVLGQDT